MYFNGFRRLITISETVDRSTLDGLSALKFQQSQLENLRMLNNPFSTQTFTTRIETKIELYGCTGANVPWCPYRKYEFRSGFAKRMLDDPLILLKKASGLGRENLSSLL